MTNPTENKAAQVLTIDRDTFSQKAVEVLADEEMIKDMESNGLGADAFLMLTLYGMMMFSKLEKSLYGEKPQENE